MMFVVQSTSLQPATRAIPAYSIASITVQSRARFEAFLISFRTICNGHNYTARFRTTFLQASKTCDKTIFSSAASSAPFVTVEKSGCLFSACPTQPKRSLSLDFVRVPVRLIGQAMGLLGYLTTVRGLLRFLVHLKTAEKATYPGEN